MKTSHWVTCGNSPIGGKLSYCPVAGWVPVRAGSVVLLQRWSWVGSLSQFDPRFYQRKWPALSRAQQCTQPPRSGGTALTHDPIHRVANLTQANPQNEEILHLKPFAVLSGQDGCQVTVGFCSRNSLCNNNLSLVFDRAGFEKEPKVAII